MATKAGNYYKKVINKKVVQYLFNCAPVILTSFLGIFAAQIFAQRNNLDPYIIYGPHGYRTFPHSVCQEVPTIDVDFSQVIK